MLKLLPQVRQHEDGVHGCPQRHNADVHVREEGHGQWGTWRQCAVGIVVVAADAVVAPTATVRVVAGVEASLFA